MAVKSGTPEGVHSETRAEAVDDGEREHIAGSTMVELVSLGLDLSTVSGWARCYRHSRVLSNHFFGLARSVC